MYQWTDRQSNAEDYNWLAKGVVIFAIIIVIALIVGVTYRSMTRGASVFHIIVSICAIVFIILMAIALHNRRKEWHHQDANRKKLAYDKDKLIVISKTEKTEVSVNDIQEIVINGESCVVRYHGLSKRFKIYDRLGLEKLIAPHFDKRVRDGKYSTSYIYAKPGYKRRDVLLTPRILIVLIFLMLVIFTRFNSNFVYLLVAYMLGVLIYVAVMRKTD